MKLYLASSWSNERYAAAVVMLRQNGHEVHDFREEAAGFNWTQIDTRWTSWNAKQFRTALDHPIVREAFEQDHKAMRRAEACVLLLPCGRSAHIEAGWFAGAAKPVIAWLDGYDRPEVMYSLCNAICINGCEVLRVLETL
jgi:hypothetical protein